MSERVGFEAWRNFFIDRVSFESADLHIIVGDGTSSKAKIVIERCEAFFYFRESDFYEKMSGYQAQSLIPAKASDCGVFRILAGSMIQSQSKNEVHDSDQPWYILIATPQECLEAKGWEMPKTFPISSDS